MQSSHLAPTLRCSKQEAPAVSPNTVLWTRSWLNSLGHHYLQAVRTPGNTAPLLHSTRLTPPLVAAPSTTHPTSTPPAALASRRKSRAGCGAPRSQTHALTTGSILDLFLHPRLSRSRAPVLVVRQPVDKSATEAVSSLRPRCNPALQDDSFYSYVLKPIFNPFNICHGDFFSFQFLTNVCCIESNTYRSHMCITSTSSSSSAPSVNLLKRQTFTRSIFHK